MNVATGHMHLDSVGQNQLVGMALRYEIVSMEQTFWRFGSIGVWDIKGEIRLLPECVGVRYFQNGRR